MSLKLPTVSIIIFAYEGINYLPATVDSILQQTDGDFEVLVFGDDYRQFRFWFRQQQDARLRFILHSNLGLAATLNQGVLAAQGKYISFIHAGDLWHPSKLEQQRLCLDRYLEVGLIHSCLLSIDHQGQNTGKIISPRADLLQPSEILAQNQIHLSSVMLRRSCFDVVGGFNPQLQTIPDWDMWIRLRKHYQFMAIAEPLVYSRQLEHNQNWLTLETDLQTTIETAYANSSPELERQKHRSYSFASLFLAQNVLQRKNPDPAIARNYWYQALVHNPLVIFTPEFCQLRWAIFCLHYRQSDRYPHLLRFIQAAKSRLKITLPQTRNRNRHHIFNWMLKPEDGSN